MQNGEFIHNSGRISYEVTGSGEPIVLVHGFSLDRTMWQPQVDHLQAGYQVITYDARGFGSSDLPEGPYDHADDLKALFTHLDLPQAHLAGLSLGGRIAVNFTLAHPQNVRSLSLLNATLDGYKNEIDWSVRASAQELNKAKQNWLQHDIFRTAQKHPQAMAILQDITDNYSGWHWFNQDPHAPSSQARQQLHEITTPTLLISGGQDLAYFRSITDVLANGIRGARTAVVPDAGHMVNLEAPAAVNQLLAAFIGENTVAASTRHGASNQR
jgi:3-oxoadipate enol-lactonase